MAKKDVKLQVFITDAMDERLVDLAELMGMHKNEVVRVAIAQYIAGWNEGVRMVRDIANKHVQSNQLGGQVELDHVMKNFESPIT